MSYIKDTFTRFKDFILDSTATLKIVAQNLSINNIKNILTIEYKNLKEKFSDLKGTNWDLAQYHFVAGNYNDAIMRFRLLQKNNYRLMEANYFLGRIYLEKGNFTKAKDYLNLYLSCQHSQYNIEAHYCMELIANGQITAIPETIIKNKRDRIALNLDKAEIDNQLLERYSFIINALKSEVYHGTKIFEAGCYIGILGRIIRETFGSNIQYLKGSEIGEESYQVATEMNISDVKVYDKVKQFTNLSDIISDNNSYSIIIIPDILNYYCDILDILIQAFASLHNEGLVIFPIRIIENATEDTKPFEFIHPIEEFRYNKFHVLNIGKSCGFQLKETYDMNDNFELFVFKKVTT
jgi:predicted TPR repeat methyltransferase